MTSVELDSFTLAYIEAALWSSTDNADDSGGKPLDANYSIDDLAPECLAEMVKDCADFQASFGAFITDDPGRAGHDFWLTRNGHGAGFWDGYWEDPYTLAQHDQESDEQHDWRTGGRTEEIVPQYPTVGHYLTAMSKPYGSCDLYIGDDGRIYCQ